MQNLSSMQLYSIILKLMLLSGIGFILYRKKVITEKILELLTAFLINLSIPCLIFTSLMRDFSFSAKPSLFFFLGLSLAIFAAGALSALILNLIIKNKTTPRETISLIAFQNSGYLPMSIIYFIFRGQPQNELLKFVFLYLLGFNILMWSVGSFFIFKQEKERFNFGLLFAPPVTATILALLAKKIIPGFIMPELVFFPLEITGEISFILSMLVLGAGLAQTDFSKINLAQVVSIAAISACKLVWVPFLFVILAAFLKLEGLIGFFVVLQASMPSAATLPIIAQWRKADYKFVSQVVFFTHLFSIITIPFWARFVLAKI